MSLMVSKRCVLALFYFVLVVSLFGQSVSDYKPLDCACHQSVQYWLAKNAYTKKQISSFPTSLQKEAAKLLLQRDSTLLSDCAKKRFITDTAFTDYLSNLFNYLKVANNLKDNEMQLMVSRVQWPNAYSMGEGTIVLNIGLLQHLENEAQLAFILCHEMAHYKLNHSMRHMESYLKKMYDGDVNKQIKEISKSEFGQNKAALKLLEGITYDTHRHGREHETEADSMGLIYLSHTVFNLQASVRSMQILDSVDVPMDSLQLPEVFKSEEFPFQPYWIKKQKTMGFGAKDGQFNSDSLKTHPDCSKRGVYLQAMVPLLFTKEGVLYHQPETAFDLLKKKAAYELVVGTYDAEHYDYCLYEALLFEQRYPDDPFGVAMASQSLYQLHDLYVGHRLMESIHSPGPQFSENLNQLLRLLSRLSLDDYAMLAKSYIKKYQPVFSKSASFNAAEKQIHSLK